MADPDFDAAALLAALDRSRPASHAFLRMAVEALSTPGMAASLRIHIPRKTSDLIEVEFYGINPHPEL